LSQGKGWEEERRRLNFSYETRFEYVYRRLGENGGSGGGRLIIDLWTYFQNIPGNSSKEKGKWRRLNFDSLTWFQSAMGKSSREKRRWRLINDLWWHFRTSLTNRLGEERAAPGG
jgi:hypothetical protein